MHQKLNIIDAPFPDYMFRPSRSSIIKEFYIDTSCELAQRIKTQMHTNNDVSGDLLTPIFKGHLVREGLEVTLL
jgi:hypothetical protein